MQQPLTDRRIAFLTAHQAAFLDVFTKVRAT